MTKLITKTIGGLVAAAALVAAASPAEARHRRHHSGSTIAAGIIGLGIGAAIASSNRGYYRGGYYDPYYGGYYDPYYGRNYYGGYYGGRSYYRHRPYRHRCVTRRVWDPYWGRRVRVRIC